MAEAKTQATDASVAAYIAAQSDPHRRADCEALVQLMGQATGQPPRMWGASIIGFDSYRYTYNSGHSGESFQTGFSSRKAGLSIYLVAAGADQASLLARLGKHKMAKACLTLKRLSDIDLAVLEKLVKDSVAEVQRQHA